MGGGGAASQLVGWLIHFLVCWLAAQLAAQASSGGCARFRGRCRVVECRAVLWHLSLTPQLLLSLRLILPQPTQAAGRAAAALRGADRRRAQRHGHHLLQDGGPGVLRLHSRVWRTARGLGFGLGQVNARPTTHSKMVGEGKRGGEGRQGEGEGEGGHHGSRFS